MVPSAMTSHGCHIGFQYDAFYHEHYKKRDYTGGFPKDCMFTEANRQRNILIHEL
jgi:hypothetical protein